MSSAVAESVSAVDTAVLFAHVEDVASAEGHAAPGGFRELYKDGPEAHYKAAGNVYRNPHEAAIIKALNEALVTYGLVRTPRTAAAAAAVVTPLTPACRILDLAAGSGEATLALESIGFRDVTGADPFTGAAYEARVGRPAQSWSFEDIANSCLSETPTFRLAVCCYALHLVEPSWMYGVLYELAQACGYLMIISPHKKPDIPSSAPWSLVPPGELRVDRVHVRLYKSLLI